MIRTSLLPALVALTLTSCAPHNPGLIPMSSAVHSTSSVRVIPASSHVTGTYPAHCIRLSGADSRLPVRSCTPGSIRSDEVNPTPAQLAATICRPGWTATIRPPESETGPLKRTALAAYGLPVTAAEERITELDHLVPLELNGSNDVSNLWPEVSDEPGHGFRNTKDGVENRLKAYVCAHPEKLSAAQNVIAVDWTTAEARLGLRPQ